MAMAVALHTALTGDKTWAPQISSTPLSVTTGGITAKRLSAETRSASPRPRWLPIVAGIAALVILVIAGIALLGRSTTPPSATQAPAADVVQVAPVAADENMVLVAQPEQAGKQPRDVT